MRPLIRAVWVFGAFGCSHGSQIVEFASAVFANINLLYGSFIQLVITFIRSSWMSRTFCRGHGSHVIEFTSAILTKVELLLS